MQQKLNELLKIGFKPNQDEIDNLIANETNLTNIPTDLMSEFNTSCELYTFMYNTVLFQKQFGQMSNYVGWQTHWKTIIQFVQTHINGESFQMKDLLCVVGGPKSGKTLTMYLSAIFMMNFVNLIRPQRENELFSQNITRIVQIDCIQYCAYDFIDKLKRIYVDVATQMQPSIKYSVQILNDQTTSQILGAIADLFVNANCYYVITWDEVQELYFKKDNNQNQQVELKDEYALGQFFKNIMVAQNSPCQHLMSASLGVALYISLKAISVNGYSVLKCKQTIITATINDEKQLQLLSNLSKFQNHFQLAMDSMTSQQLSLSCANLAQVIQECNQLSTNQIQDTALITLLIQKAVYIVLERKRNIAKPWIISVSSSPSIATKEIFACINGTTQQPGDLINKICHYDETTKEYKFLDSSLSQALSELVSTMPIENIEQQQVFSNITIYEISKLGKCISDLNLTIKLDQRSEAYKSINDCWIKQIKDNNLKQLSKQEQRGLLEFQQAFYIESTTITLQHQLKIEQCNLQQQPDDIQLKNIVQKRELAIQTWSNTSNREKQSLKIWGTADQILVKIRHMHTHNIIIDQKLFMSNLEKYLGGCLTLQKCITELQQQIAIIQQHQQETPEEIHEIPIKTIAKLLQVTNIDPQKVKSSKYSFK
ncbi:Hypothetical_protein [Hexamita inflata]|uniref:Hypothetical_protein n=1 Tax=Hexamita inflata TaxID=28002 RepID=A0AA86NKQ3_9EUKA|nr:Hypothetical protein HINF_LOCUS8773 [Hexamita inflata]